MTFFELVNSNFKSNSTSNFSDLFHFKAFFRFVGSWVFNVRISWHRPCTISTSVAIALSNDAIIFYVFDTHLRLFGLGGWDPSPLLIWFGEKIWVSSRALSALRAGLGGLNNFWQFFKSLFLDFDMLSLCSVLYDMLTGLALGRPKIGSSVVCPLLKAT